MSGGFPYEVAQQASRDLYCLICLNLMRDATQLTCGHGMCKTCLEDLEKSSIERKFGFVCPTCRQEIDKSTVTPAAMINRIILSLKVKCEHSDKGCEWIGELSNTEDHLQKQCAFQLVCCTFELCEEMVERHELTIHEEKCPYKPEACQFCQLVVLRLVIEDHYHTCGKFPVKCPNNCSDEMMKREAVEHHRGICQEEIVPCEYFAFGCSYSCSRKCLSKHYDDSLRQHLSLTLHEIASMKEKKLEYMDIMKKDVEGMQVAKREFDSMQGMKDEFEAMKMELKSMQVMRYEVAAMKREFEAVQVIRYEFEGMKREFKDMQVMRDEFEAMKREVKSMQLMKNEFEAMKREFKVLQVMKDQFKVVQTMKDEFESVKKMTKNLQAQETNWCLNKLLLMIKGILADKNRGLALFYKSSLKRFDLTFGLFFDELYNLKSKLEELDTGCLLEKCLSEGMLLMKKDIFISDNQSEYLKAEVRKEFGKLVALEKEKYFKSVLTTEKRFEGLLNVMFENERYISREDFFYKIKRNGTKSINDDIFSCSIKNQDFSLEVKLQRREEEFVECIFYNKELKEHHIELKRSSFLPFYTDGDCIIYRYKEDLKNLCDFIVNNEMLLRLSFPH